MDLHSAHVRAAFRVRVRGRQAKSHCSNLKLHQETHRSGWEQAAAMVVLHVV